MHGPSSECCTVSTAAGLAATLLVKGVHGKTDTFGGFWRILVGTDLLVQCQVKRREPVSGIFNAECCRLLEHCVDVLGRHLVLQGELRRNNMSAQPTDKKRDGTTALEEGSGHHGAIVP